MSKYPFKEIEKKWQRFWDREGTFRVTEDPSIPPEKRAYILDMFPYPSAAGLHVGHPEGYTATDIYSRYLRMQGFAVLHPMGFDSFGLPAENYAIQTGTHPRTTTEANIRRFREQIKSLGFSYDWDREVSTHEPEYYRWTQWIFLKLYERGLAYSAEIPVWYCEALGTVLANEEVLTTPDGPRSERGSHPVERRPLRQWILRITEYADRLLNDLEKLDWPESIKAMQRNWIGRSEGANVRFALADGSGRIEVFTTRPDTLFGATYMVLAPEHPLVSQITAVAQRDTVAVYVEQARLKTDLERTDLAKDKTGVFTGAFAINPVNEQHIPIWISDYILLSYGTGAIMAVPAHDTRDWEFAETFNLPIVQVVEPPADLYVARTDDGALAEAFVGDGTAVNSGQFDGLETEVFKQRITAWLEENQLGRRAVNYKLRDWIFSRQRYWGEPIPLVHCGDRIVPLPYDQLPLRLPEVESYKPSGTGESPLAKVEEWVSTGCPDGSGGSGHRETNTMPQWAGSCWYYLRYLDPRNQQELAARDKIDYWMPVDLYVGGAEHAVLHLLYARFWHKVLYDIGVVNSDEPFMRLINQGMILGEDGLRMSKSRGNVVNPDDVVDTYGADTLRMFEMFLGPLEAEKAWTTGSISGVHRFLDRVWRLAERELLDGDAPEHIRRQLHKTIRKVTHDTSRLEFNTAIAQMMIYVNDLYKVAVLHRSAWEPFLLLLAPYAPHLAEELWERAGNRPPVSLQRWPQWNEQLTRDEQVTVVVQVNGRVRARLELPTDTPKSELKRRALGLKRIAELTDGKQVVKIITVPNKLVNIVAR
ncbi:MAG: leucine--tRNA ligase [Spirochaetaceae bacterium]|nr:MAG: leucine--tRNA ligase [Spirochaetaceae bacterium]